MSNKRIMNSRVHDILSVIIDRVAGEIMIMYRVVGFLFDACGVSSCGFWAGQAVDMDVELLYVPF